MTKSLYNIHAVIKVLLYVYLEIPEVDILRFHIEVSRLRTVYAKIVVCQAARNVCITTCRLKALLCLWVPALYTRADC